MPASPVDQPSDDKQLGRLEAGKAGNLASLQRLHAGLLSATDELNRLTAGWGGKIDAPFRPSGLHVTVDRLAGPEVGHEVIDGADEVLDWCGENCVHDVRLDWTLDAAGRLVPMFRCRDRDDAEALAERWNGTIWN